MRSITISGAAALLATLAGCAAAPRPALVLAPAPTVQARGETDPVGTSQADAADDPAIWRNPANPAASLIVATDKKAGLYLYGLDGHRRDFITAGLLNNVDLRDGVTIAGQPGVLVAASDRTDRTRAAIALFRLDTAAARLSPIGRVPVAPGEAYGFCMGRIAGQLYGFVVLKDGTIAQVALDLAGAAPATRVVRRLKLATQSEGCVVDEDRGTLFVAEEDIGIWRFDARPDGPVAATPVATVDGRHLIADVEGLAIAGDWLVASSQGDNAYALFRLSDNGFAGRFRIAAGRFGATSETDGIEIATGDFGPGYPGGLMVVQDGDNAPAAQNFKLVAWAEVLEALELAP
jgi:3-phytase